MINLILPATAEIFSPVRKEFFVKLPARLANQNARKENYDFQKKKFTGTAKFENHYCGGHKNVTSLGMLVNVAGISPK